MTIIHSFIHSFSFEWNIEEIKSQYHENWLAIKTSRQNCLLHISYRNSV